MEQIEAPYDDWVEEYYNDQDTEEMMEELDDEDDLLEMRKDDARR